MDCGAHYPCCVKRYPKNTTTNESCVNGERRVTDYGHTFFCRFVPITLPHIATHCNTLQLGHAATTLQHRRPRADGVNRVRHSICHQPCERGSMRRGGGVRGMKEWEGRMKIERVRVQKCSFSPHPPPYVLSPLPFPPPIKCCRRVHSMRGRCSAPGERKRIGRKEEKERRLCGRGEGGARDAGLWGHNIRHARKSKRDKDRHKREGWNKNKGTRTQGRKGKRGVLQWQDHTT